MANIKIKKFRDWSFLYKVFGINVIGFIGFILLISLYILPTIRTQILEEKKLSIEKIVNVGFNILRYYDSKVEASELSLQDAQKLAKEEIGKFKYGNDDYFWINDLSCNMIMNATKPELNGTSMFEFKDPDNKYIFREFVQIAKTKGDGLLEYSWPKPGYEKPVPKISYVKLFDKWGWVLGTGIYVNDVDKEYYGIQQNIYLILGMLITALITFSFIFSKKLVKPIYQLKEASDKVAQGEMNVHVDFISNDEIGKLAGSFNSMAEKIATQIQYLENIPTPVMIIDNDFNIQFMNKKGAEIVGKNHKEVVGQKCYDNFKTGDCKTENCALYKAMKRDNIFSQETIARPNGYELPILYTGAPVKNRGGKIIGAVEAITDIREIKEMQNYLTRSTKKMMLAMEQFEKGNLTITVSPEKDDDIGRLFKGFNKTVSNMKQIIETVKDAVESITQSSTEISASTEEMSIGGQEQSNQTNEVAAAVEQMTRTILETTRNAGTASENVKKAGLTAVEGGKVVEETVTGMKRIAEVVSRAAETVKQLGNSSNQIGEIVQVIDDIADQTNLLALNAAIEAARAGEQGRGFAVVADEVRKLAERTTKATKEIALMIKQIQSDTSEAVNSIEEGNSEVKKGREMANKAGESLKEIINASNKVVDDVNQVASASEEQSVTAEQISKNIEAINSVSHENASGIAQVARSAEDLNRLTENLQNIINRFKVDTGETTDFYLNKVSYTN